MNTNKVMLSMISLFMAVWILPGCSSSGGEYRELFTFSPLNPQQGKTITLYYNTRHEKCPFVNAGDLYLTTVLRTQDSSYLLRKIMKAMSGNEGIVTASVRIPENALHVLFSVKERDREFVESPASSPVFINDSVVAEGSLAYVIVRSRSYEQASEYYKLDQKLYPESKDRIAALWHGLVYSHADSTEIVSKANVMYNQMTDDGFKNRNQLSMATACCVAFENSRQYEKLVVMLRRISESMKTYGIRMNDLAEMILGSSFYRILERRSRGDRSDNGLLAEIVNQMCAIGMIGRHLYFLDLINMYSKSGSAMMVGEVSNTFVAHPAYQFAKNLVFHISENEYYSNSSMLYRVMNDSYIAGDYEYCIKAALSLNSKLDASIQWTRENEDAVVPISPEYGYESQTRLLLANAYMNVADTVNAVQIWKWLANRDANEEYLKLAVYRSSAALSSHYAHINKKDSAAMYLGRMYTVNAPQAEETYNEVRKIYHGAFYSQPEIISKYYDPNYLVKKRVKNLAIPVADNKTVALNNTSGTTMVILGTTHCSVCRKMVPSLLKLCFGDNYRDQIVFMTDDEKYKWIEGGTKNTRDEFHYAPVDNAVLRALDIKSEPSFCVVKNGLIIASGGVNEVAYAQIRKAIAESGRSAVGKVSSN